MDHRDGVSVTSLAMVRPPVRVLRLGEVLAQQAVKIGMADRVATLDSTISRLLGRVGERSGTKAEGKVNVAAMMPARISAGRNLGRVLNELIDGKVTEERSRQDIIKDMADEADVSPSTVEQILMGKINCPPLDRLEGFARVLDVPVKRLVDAAEEDGCDYSENEDSQARLLRRRVDWL